MKLKRILAGVLSAAMVLTCAPVSGLSVTAADDGEIAVVDDTAEAAGGEVVVADDAYTIDEEGTSSLGATISEDGNEVIFTPNEEGTFDVINSTDNAEIMNFLNTMGNFEVTVVYRFTDTADLTETSYALFTLADDDAAAAATGATYFTVRHAPKRSGMGGDIAWAYNGSTGGLKFGHSNFEVSDTKWHKLSFSMSSGKKSNIVFDGHAPITDNFNASSYCPAGFPGTGEANGATTFDHAYIGKVAPGKTYAQAVGSNVDFPGEIKYVKISKASYANQAALMAENTTISDLSQTAWTEAKTECKNNATGDYTLDSWNAYSEKLNAEPSTEWDTYNAIDELKAAYAALETSTEESKNAVIAEFELAMDLGRTYIREGSDAYTSGYKELETELQTAEDMYYEKDVYTELEIWNEIVRLKEVFSKLVFVDGKVYTDVSVGKDIYAGQDAAFYSYMGSLTFTAVFKYNGNVNTAPAPLITLSNTAGKWVTIYYWADATNGHFAFSYPGSGATGFTIRNVDNEDSETPGIAKIGDNQYHKMTFSFKEGVFRIALDDKEAGWVTDANLPASQTVPWFGTLIDVLNDNVWTNVEIGKKFSKDNISAKNMTYSEAFPDATFKYVEISRNACDGAGVMSKNDEVNTDVQKEYTALLEAKRKLTEADYTADSWNSLQTTLTDNGNATSDWAMLNAMDAINAVELVAPVTGIMVTDTIGTLEVGDARLLKATVKPEVATSKEVTWSSSDGKVATVDASTGLVTAVAAGSVTITATSTDGTDVAGTYTLTVKPNTYKVTVGEKGSIEGTEGTSRDFSSCERATVNTAAAPSDNQAFQYWKDENGTIMCYAETYSFPVINNITLTPVYAAAALEEKTVVASLSAAYNGSKNRIVFSASRAVPSELTNESTVVEHGVIVTKDATVGASTDSFVIDGKGVVKVAAKTKGLLGTYTLNVSCAEGTTCYGRTFVTYVDKDGNTQTVYSAIASALKPAAN